MVLLQTTFWGDFPTWVQAICAIITLLVSIVTLFISKKVKELSDIADALQQQTAELSNQNSLLSKQAALLVERYHLEFINTLPERMPYYIKASFTPSEIQHSLIFKNVGLESADVYLSTTDNDLFKGIELHADNFESGSTITVLIQPRTEFLRSEFKFLIFFPDRLGKYLAQVVSVAPTKVFCNVAPPVPIKEIPSLVIIPKRTNRNFGH